MDIKNGVSRIINPKQEALEVACSVLDYRLRKECLEMGSRLLGQENAYRIAHLLEEKYGVGQIFHDRLEENLALRGKILKTGLVFGATLISVYHPNPLTIALAKTLAAT